MQVSKKIGATHASESLQLATWSAADFSRIYVNNQTSLVRFASRLVGDRSIAEEVVQDAFLYLMTALPEIDSETGVIRYLTWKVRMLSLDVIRANGSVREFEFLEELDSPSYDTIEEDLEKADDAAVVALALAKLNPRHREALISIMYEEKSHADASNSMGLSENAFRQLLFRAKSAFKSALIGEAEASGKSISELLSLAGRHASSNAKRAAVGSSLVILAAIAFIGFPSPSQDSNLAMVETEDSRVTIDASSLPVPMLDSASPTETNEGSQQAPSLESKPSQQETQVPIRTLAAETGALIKPEVVEYASSESFDLDEKPNISLALTNLRQVSTEERMLTSAVNFDVLSSRSDVEVFVVEGSAEGRHRFTSESGNETSLTLQFESGRAASESSPSIFIELLAEGYSIIASPQLTTSICMDPGTCNQIEIFATDFTVFDATGDFGFESSDSSLLFGSLLRIKVNMNQNGDLVSGSARMETRRSNDS